MSRGLESVDQRERLETKNTERTRELELQFYLFIYLFIFKKNTYFGAVSAFAGLNWPRAE